MLFFFFLLFDIKLNYFHGKSFLPTEFVRFVKMWITALPLSTFFFLCRAMSLLRQISSLCLNVKLRPTPRAAASSATWHSKHFPWLRRFEISTGLLILWSHLVWSGKPHGKKEKKKKENPKPRSQSSVPLPVCPPAASHSAQISDAEGPASLWILIFHQWRMFACWGILCTFFREGIKGFGSCQQGS